MSESNNPTDFVLQQAREKASRVAPEDLQRELLARQLEANYYMRVQNTTMSSIKSIAVFFLVMYLLSMFAAAAMILG